MPRLAHAALMLLLLGPAAAGRVFPVPPTAPAITVTTPSSWKVEEIEHGYSATSPGEDVFFSVEYESTQKGVDALMKDNDDWMKENKIKQVAPTKEEGAVNGVSMTHFEFDTTDANGKTLVDFFLIPAGDSLAMLTFWGSVEERNKHKDDIVGILNSIKPAK